MTLRIRKRLVAIISVLLVLTLVTTISFDASYSAFATEGEEAVQEEQNNGDGEAAAEEGSQEKGDKKEKKKKKKADKDKENAEAKDGEAAAAEGENAENAEGQTEGEEGAEGEITKEDLLNLGPGATGLKSIAGKPDVTSSSYIVMSGSTSEVVLKRHPARKMSPGKATMLMTAMVVIDHLYNDEELKNSVEITEKLASYGTEFRQGESISVGDLLNAMLVGGSEQSAEALASYSATKRKIFINEMNQKAMELGLMDTQFSNPRGAYSDKQYSTAKDLAIIMQAAYRYQLIKEAFALRSFNAEAVSKESTRDVMFPSQNPIMVSSRPSDIYKFSKGGIKGTVGDPVEGSQYAGIASVNDMQLIVILMDSDEDSLAYEAKGLLQYADTKVTRNVVIEAGEKVGRVKVKGGVSTWPPAYTETKGFVYVPPEGSEDLITKEVYLYDNLEAPLKEGTKVGEYRIYVADELKGTVDIVIKRDIPAGWFPSKIYISNNMVIAIGVILLFILLVFFRIGSVKRRRRRRKLKKREERIRQIALEQMAIDEDRRRRNWNYTTSYDKVAPRTGDLRREAIEAELRRQKELEAEAKGSRSRKKKAKKK